jgi:hypothetical protein
VNSKNKNISDLHRGINEFKKDRLCGLVVRNLWLQIQSSWFDSKRYQISWEIMCLERGPLSLMSTIEELLRKK